MSSRSRHRAPPLSLVSEASNQSKAVGDLPRSDLGYDPNRPFGPWLVAIARRRIVDRLRHQGRATSREVALGDEHETFSTVEANLGEAACNRRVLDDAVEHLPPSQRQAIRLLKLQEMTLKEAAAVSGMTIVSLKVATHRALRNLRKMLTERGDKR